MTLKEAAEKGILRVRRPMWISDTAYLRIYPHQGWPGAFGKLYDRATQEVIEVPCPQEVFILLDETDDFEEYHGPVDEADK